MYRMLRLLCVAAVLSLLAACKSSEGPKEGAQMDESPDSLSYVQMAHDRFGENAEFMENPTGEFVLVVSKSKPDQMNPHPEVAFFVYGKDESEVTYESEIVGSVTWLDDYYLEVVVVPGIVKADSEPGGVTYRVDARSGSRVEMKGPSRRR